MNLDFDRTRLCRRDVEVPGLKYHDAGVMASWQDGYVALSATCLSEEAGITYSCLEILPGRPFPASVEEAVKAVKQLLREYGEKLTADFLDGGK